jgi:hypothetical protein
MNQYNTTRNSPLHHYQSHDTKQWHRICIWGADHLPLNTIREQIEQEMTRSSITISSMHLKKCTQPNRNKRHDLWIPSKEKAEKITRILRHKLKWHTRIDTTIRKRRKRSNHDIDIDPISIIDSNNDNDNANINNDNNEIGIIKEKINIKKVAIKRMIKSQRQRIQLCTNWNSYFLLNQDSIQMDIQEGEGEEEEQIERKKEILKQRSRLFNTVSWNTAKDLGMTITTITKPSSPPSLNNATTIRKRRKKRKRHGRSQSTRIITNNNIIRSTFDQEKGKRYWSLLRRPFSNKFYHLWKNRRNRGGDKDLWSWMKRIPTMMNRNH